MGRSRYFGRSLHGLLVLNKPLGITSNQALQQAKHLFFAHKSGHTGSLDPLATGVLPLCFGEATKFSQHLLDADKRYTSTFRLGQTTSTADCEGEVLSHCCARHITQAQVEAAISGFCGAIQQVPPMVSALKHQGQPLYKLARQGIEIERAPRAVTIYQYRLLAFRPGELAEVDVDIHCSKGTYIRSLAQDLGQVLGVGGHVTALHRTQAGPFSIEQAHSLASLYAARGEAGPEVLDTFLLPVDAALHRLPALTLEDHSAHYFCQGQAVMDLRVYRLGQQGDKVRVFHPDGLFLGVGEITDEGTLAPRRIMVLDAGPKRPPATTP